MKFFTLALFLGVISADQLEDFEDETDLFSVRISKAGQEEIENEFDDVTDTMKKIEHSRPVRNLKNSLKKFAKTKEVANLKALDKKFIASPAGQKLVAEWKDVGLTLKDNVKYQKVNGHQHFYMPNNAFTELSDELTDVAYEYKYLEGSAWDKAYEAGFKAAFSTKQAAQVGRRWKTFKASPEGQALKKEMVELKNSLKKNVMVSDLPDDSDDFEDEADLVHVHVSDAGRKAIEKELDDIEMVAKKIKDNRPVRNLKNSIKKWDKSAEVDDLRELDKQFLASPEGKKLMLEWEDFGHALKEHVKHDNKGIHVDHAGMQIMEDEVDDIDHEYKELAQTPWAKKYDDAWKAATSNKQAQQLGRRFEHFKASDEWKMLKKELTDLKMALKKHVKITDCPKDVAETVELLHIQLSHQGQAEIEKELNDVRKTMKAQAMTRTVRNLKNSLKRWAMSDEMEDLHKLDRAFWASPEGKDLKLELEDIVHGLDGHIKKTKKGYHIDHAGLQYIDDDLDDVKHVMDELKDSKWNKLYKDAWQKTVTNKEAESVQRRAKTFKQSIEWANLKKELKELDQAMAKNIKVTDGPQDMYLF